MKYNININQLVMSKTSFDLIDCAILDYLIVICTSMNSKISSRRKNGFTQIDYSSLLADMPLLRLTSKGALSTRIKKIEKEGFIQVTRTKHQSNFVKLTAKIDTLFIKEAIHVDEQAIHVDEQAIHVDEQLKEKAVHLDEPIIILDSYNNNTILSQPKADVEEFNFLEYTNKMLESNQRHIRIIGKYLQMKHHDQGIGHKMKKPDIQLVIKSQLRDAKALETLPAKRIVELMEKAIKHSEHGKKYDWKLSTLIKLIA